MQSLSRSRQVKPPEMHSDTAYTYVAGRVKKGMEN